MVTAARISGIEPLNVIAAFAQYGFRKTSMEDIAKSVNLSRQSIYKKFGSKEACYTWALRTYMTTLYQSVFALLDEASDDPLQVLEDVLVSIVGDSVELAKTQHGSELLEDALKAASEEDDNLPRRYEQKLSEYLLRQNLATGDARAVDLAHVLVTATRGALVAATSRESYVADIKRILQAMFPAC